MLFHKNPHKLGLKWKLIGLAGKLFIDFLFLSSRVHTKNRRSVDDLIASRRFIFAIWHSRILLPAYVYKNLNASILVSNSADGEIIAQILKQSGHQTIRGSTGKGGLRALMNQIMDMRIHGRPGVVTPDGPQGPRHRVQPGVILLAQKTGYPIIPIGYSARRRKIFNSWDRFMLPRPWTQCLMTYGHPIEVPLDADIEILNLCTKQLEDELNRVTRVADEFYGHRFQI